MMRLVTGLVFAGFAMLLLMTIGVALMNNVLLEFLGPSAPQPSVLAWSTFWASIFIMNNAKLGIDRETIRSWVTGEKERVDELEEIRSLRRDVQKSLLWTQEYIDEVDSD